MMMMMIMVMMMTIIMTMIIMKMMTMTMIIMMMMTMTMIIMAMIIMKMTMIMMTMTMIILMMMTMTMMKMTMIIMTMIIMTMIIMKMTMMMMTMTMIIMMMIIIDSDDGYSDDNFNYNYIITKLITVIIHTTYYILYSALATNPGLTQTFYPTNSFLSSFVLLFKIIYFSPVLFCSLVFLFFFVIYLLINFFPLKIPIIRPAEYKLPINKGIFICMSVNI